jgi:hypothetical protein
MRLKRKRPASSVEPDHVEAAAEVLERWATRGSRQARSMSTSARRRGDSGAPVGAQRYPPTEPLESRSVETPVSTPRVGGDGASEVGEPVRRTARTPPVPPQPENRVAREWGYLWARIGHRSCGTRQAERVGSTPIRRRRPQQPTWARRPSAAKRLASRANHGSPVIRPRIFSC